MVTTIKEKVSSLFEEVQSLIAFIFLLPLLTFLSLCFLKDLWVRGNGE